MSVLDQIRRLEEQKAQLLKGAKQEALEQAQTAVKTLNDLGYPYRLIEGHPSDSARGANGTHSSNGARHVGIRQQVRRLVAEHEQGVNRARLLELMGAKGDKQHEASVSNALAGLKKAGTLELENGLYKAS